MITALWQVEMAVRRQVKWQRRKSAGYGGRRNWFQTLVLTCISSVNSDAIFKNPLFCCTIIWVVMAPPLHGFEENQRFFINTSRAEVATSAIVVCVLFLFLALQRQPSWAWNNFPWVMTSSELSSGAPFSKKLFSDPQVWVMSFSFASGAQTLVNTRITWKACEGDAWAHHQVFWLSVSWECVFITSSQVNLMLLA